MTSSSQTTVFRSNKTQAVRLPKALELPESVKKVTITAIGNTRVIAPVEASWDAWFDGPDVSADFMVAREQPDDQAREAF
ncbi:Antitoxin VapB [Thauera sp. GDN1]|uniref:type II toxin-antitoxin system VapB family antitoxin n=1 Tax=Thauera sp. GDN1 TaxID=2944810 RepID=UPI002479F134|nr:type II toxin-antitoxin system VapB family antitoxin [Thauera sp. GDN1]WEN43755.1 Antitoxin VapB [Thauera sp. GDN1]